MTETFKHSVKTEPEDPVALNVTYSGHQKCSGSHRWGKGVREQFILHFIVEGSGTYVTPKQSFSLSSGDVFLIRPFTEIEYFADPDDPWEYYWVNFTGKDAELLLRMTDFTEECPVMHPDCPELIGELEKMLEAGGSSRWQKIGLTGRLYIILSMLAASSKPRRHSGEQNRIVMTAVDYISENYPMPISVDDISAAASVSRTTLFRAFKSELGTSPAEYLIEYRISRAKQLLSDTDISVAAAARSTGYEDSAYFSRAFHRMTGMTPSEYRAASGRYERSD